jgi:hypothetical protein
VPSASLGTCARGSVRSHRPTSHCTIMTFGRAPIWSAVHLCERAVRPLRMRRRNLKRRYCLSPLSPCVRACGVRCISPLLMLYVLVVCDLQASSGGAARATGSKAVSFASITNEVLARAAQFQHDKARSAKHACPVPQPRAASDVQAPAPAPAQAQAGAQAAALPQASAERIEAEATATDFLRTVEYCTGTAEHTRFHSRQSAVKNFAVSNAYGKATYWYIPFAVSSLCIFEVSVGF